MRKALLVTGVLGAVMVFAVGVVAFVAFRGSPSASSKAADVAKSTVVAKPTASAKPSPSPTAKKTKKAAKAKPKSSPKPSKSATPTPKPTHSTVSTVSSGLTVPAGWKLAFDPSFSGSSLSTGTWSTCYDESDGSAGCTNNPSVENEWYLPSQVSVSGGTLNLTAKQETTQGTSGTYGCRSGMVTSEPSFNFTYGLIQITAKIPYGPGLWPALWLEPSNGDWPPELDILEHWYSDQDYKVYEHYTNATDYLGGPVPTPVNLSAGYNTFSMLWTSSRVTWYLDGTQVYTTTSYVPQQAMYFIANVADRNPTNGTTALVPGACTGTMSISSVKVWTP
ncbi:MAG TPA: glycoside hydrolase family 16 protein [Trebonia sp.]